MKDEAEREISYEEFYDEIFESAEASEIPEIGLPPRKLLGEIWHEGEMAVLFGESSTGKSVLATQIADGLARGKGFGPFEVEGGPRKVLYFDLKLDSRKWLSRYAEEPDEDATKKRKRHKFSKNLTRVHIRTEMRLPKGHTSFTLPFARALRQYIERKKPDVVIFDSLTRLKHSNDVTRDVLPVMRELSRLKKEMNISILVLAQSQQHHWTGSLQMTDLRGMRSVCNIADSIFAIGSGRIPGDVYIKQLRSYLAERLYDESHVPVFRVEKPHFESFLCFTFRHFAKEASARRSLRDLDRCPVMDEAKALREKGFSLRTIASMLNTSRTSVHRMLQQWTEPPMPGTQASRLPVEQDEYDIGASADLSVPGAVATGDFDDTDEYDIDADEPPKPGTQASRLPVDDEYDGGLGDDLSEPGAIATGFFDDEGGFDCEERRHSREIILGDEPEEHSSSANRAAQPQEEWKVENGEVRTEEQERISRLSIINSNLNEAIRNGRDHWVEKYDENGRREIWYRRTSAGLRRYIKDGTGGVFGESAEIDSS